jgi:hypothetical protein
MQLVSCRQSLREQMTDMAGAFANSSIHREGVRQFFDPAQKKTRV